MVTEGLPLIFSAIFLTVHNYADALLLDKLSTPFEVSAFGAGMRILSAIVFLPGIFSAVIGPRVTQALSSSDVTRVQDIVSKGLRLLVITATLIMLVLTCAPKTIITILFGGDKYGDASTLVMIFGWAFLPMAFASFMIEIAIAEGKLWIPAVYTGIIMVVSVSMDLLLIPTYGAFGSAIAKCTAISCGALTIAIIIKQLDVIRTLDFFYFIGKSVISIAIPLGVYFFIHRQFNLTEIPTTLLTVISFGLLVFGLRIFRVQELLTILRPSEN
jgi:O-antigen/teichoic acid export membrane protein